MKRKSLKALSLALTTVMVLSSVNPAAVAVAAPVEEAVVVQQAETDEVTTEQASEEATEAVVAEVTTVETEVLATETTTELVSEETTTEVATTQAEEATTEEEETATTEAIEAKADVVEKSKKREATGSTALLSSVMDKTLLNLVVTEYNKAATPDVTASTMTIKNLESYSGTLVLTSSTVKNIAGLGYAVNASSIDISGLTAVTSIPDKEFFGCSFTTFKMPTSITSIGEQAFYECQNMTSIYTGNLENTLPSKLASLGQHAFDSCNALTTITIPTLTDEGAVSAFQFCGKLESVTFGNGVTKVPVSAFQSAGTNGNGMTVSFGTGLDKILGSAFQNAKFASDCTINLSGCSKMTGIDASAFRECQNLKTVILPNTLSNMEIGAYAFAKTTLSKMYPSNQSSYAGVYLPSYVKSLGDGAFYGVDTITKVSLSPSLPAIRDYTFDGCSSLATIDTQSGTYSTTWIGDCAFRGTAITNTDFLLKMTKLTQIGRQLHDTVEDGKSAKLKSLPEGGVGEGSKTVNADNPNKKVYDKKPVGSEVFSNCPGLASITIPGSVTTIAHRAFYSTENSGKKNDSVVTTFTWKPASPAVAGRERKIWPEAFVGNYKLATVVLPENKGESLVIEQSAFRENIALTSVGPTTSNNNTLPNTLSYLGASAFYHCEVLPEIHIQAYNGMMPTLNIQTFEGCYSLTKATLPSQVQIIPYHFFAACPLRSFNFGDMSNLVEIRALAFLGNEFTDVDLSVSTKLKELGGCSFASEDTLIKTYMDDYDVSTYSESKLTKMILPQSVENELHINTGVFAYQEKFTTLYKKGSTVSNKVVIPAYVSDSSDSSQGIFRGTAISSVVWEADTNATAAGNRWNRIDVSMFAECPNIADAKDVLPLYVEDICRNAFTGSGIKSADLTKFTHLSEIGVKSGQILTGTFANCEELATVKLPATTTAKKGIIIDENTFSGDAALTSVDLGAATMLGKKAFNACTSLETIDLKNVTEVGESAFVGCTALEKVDFGVVELIGKSAFESCIALVLTNTPLPGTLTEIGGSAFKGDTSLGKVTFGSGLTEIGSSAFINSGLTAADFSKASQLNLIGASAFSATKLTSFNLSGTKVTLVASKLLFDCPNLTSATFGQEIQYIEDNALAGCPKFKTLSFYTTTTVSQKVFYAEGTNDVISGQNNTGIMSNSVSISILAKTPKEVIIPLDRELDFPYYVNVSPSSNIQYICIKDNNAPKDETVEEHLFISAKTYSGYYKIENSNNSANKISDEYYESLETAPTIKVNNKTVDVIRVKGLKASGTRDLELNIYANISFLCDSDTVSINPSAFEAKYKVSIQDPQTKGVLYSDSKWTNLVSSKSNIQVSKTKQNFVYYYDLVDKIATGAKPDNYNLIVESSNPDVLAVNISTSSATASGSCTVEATSTSGVTKDSNKKFYVFPKKLGTATITIYPELYSKADREKYKQTYTFTVNSNVKSLTLEVPAAYKSKLNPGSSFCVFKEYTNYFDQKCTVSDMSKYNTYTNTKIVFASSDPDYVSIDQKGNVKILKADPQAKTVTITATYPNATSVSKKTLSLRISYPEVKKNAQVVDNLTGSEVTVTKPSTKDLEGEVKYTAPTDKKKTTVVIPDTVSINGIKYKVTTVSAKAFKNNKKVKTLKIGKYVKTIEKEAFSGCTKLSKVTIGNAVETIDAKAFYKCTSLKTVSISATKSKLKTIGDNAFYNCKKLTKITLPKKFKKLGAKAFCNCKKLKTITVKSTALSSVGKDALKGIYKKAVIKVPKKKLKAYKNLFKGKGQKSSVKIKK